MSVVYGLLMQSKLHFLAALRDGILTHLKSFVKEVSHTHTNTKSKNTYTTIDL